MHIYFTGDYMKETASIFFIKLLISIVLTLIILIIIKSSTNFKTIFYKKVYTENISFTAVTEIYNKYIGELNIFDNKTELVFNESLVYGNKERGMARFESLLKLFELEERLVCSPEEVNKVLQTLIDWERVNSIHKLMKEKSLSFLSKYLK
jgi:hypothetical protein